MIEFKNTTEGLLSIIEILIDVSVESMKVLNQVANDPTPANCVLAEDTFQIICLELIEISQKMAVLTTNNINNNRPL